MITTVLSCYRILEKLGDHTEFCFNTGKNCHEFPTYSQMVLPASLQGTACRTPAVRQCRVTISKNWMFHDNKPGFGPAQRACPCRGAVNRE
jgi:hypothetical protein